MPILQKVKRQVTWALEVAPKLAPTGSSVALTSQGEMWIVANGFSNAFYSINETLKNVEVQRDPILRRVRDEWWQGGGKKEFEALLGKFRNSLTHQGVFELEASVAWEIDHDHDTAHPTFSYPFAVNVIGGERTEYTFQEWVHFCFQWWVRQIARLEGMYVAAGGVIEPEPETNWNWSLTNRAFAALE